MPRTIVIATRNRRKFQEMAAILRGVRADLKSPDDFGPLPPVEETGETFEENARAKAAAYARITGQWALADDSGLEVDALGGRPGVRSSRWGGREGDDDLNNRTLLRALAGHPRDAWTARYRCVAALAAPEASAPGGARVIAVTEGSCDGLITDQPAGSNGFGYDPHFLVPGRGCTMAQLPPEVKNRISHRARALAAMRKELEKIL
ncbi:MAG: RdgB/HAM1 family non-canonical purine NTP pyrophosphatase [Planctomycetes bacterium]|nr:RdgB/HAM1 family non-canonical purine NTP pyrophosphatase [Planctomycetota bacterium]